MYYLHFSTPKQVEASSTSGKKAGDTKELSTAFINADSLLNNYDLFKELKAQLEEKGKKLEAELKNRGEGLQREINDFQKNVRNLTINQAKALEEDLVKKQQNYRVYQENLSRELLSDEAKMNQDLNDRVYQYLEKYGEEKGLKLVVKYNRGSDIVYADSTMDITQVIIDGLNDEYKKENETATEADTLSTK